MKKLLFLIAFLAFPLTAQVPTRLFDVRNGNGIVDGANAYAAATYIAYKDAASKNKIIDAFCAAYGYQTTIGGQPNPQSKQAFYNQQLTRFIKEVYKAQLVKAAAETAGKNAGDSADAEVPPQ